MTDVSRIDINFCTKKINTYSCISSQEVGNEERKKGKREKKHAKKGKKIKRKKEKE